MAMKDFVSKGIGFNPGKIGFFITKGLTLGAVITAPTADTIKLVSYVDQNRSITSYVNQTLSITSWVDQNIKITSH